MGPASGTNFCLAEKVAERLKSNNVVTIFTDRMERYFSTPIFDQIKNKITKRRKKVEREEIIEETKNAILKDSEFFEKIKDHFEKP